MITVTFTRRGYTVEGHAGYAERGADIVCSAVSVLAQTITRTLEDEVPVKLEVKDGYFSASTNWETNSTRTLIRALRVGLRAIQSQYPSHVQIKEEE